MIFRGILAGIFVFLASFVNASQLCEQILKEDFRETSNIKLVHHDGGIVLHPNKTLIDKIRFGSAAAEINLNPGDTITAVDGSSLPLDQEEAYKNLTSILETPGIQKILLDIQRPDGSTDTLLLKKDSYFGHPIVETDIILNDIEITHQSSKTRLDLDIHLKWDNDKIIHRLEKILNNPNQELINCQFRKSPELDNILKKIWYPWFDTTLVGASVENIKYENLNNNDKVSKISIVGAGMVSTPGVTYRMFRALAEEKINILAISTSEIKISVIIGEENTLRAIKKITYNF